MDKKYLAITIIFIALTGIFFLIFKAITSNGINTFSDSNLGIQFQYASTNNSAHVITKTVGNSVFVYLSNNNPTQYVKVLSKPSNQTLEDAVKTYIISKQGKISNCRVILNQPVDLRKYDKSHIQVAHIESINNKVDCPDVGSNGIVYFVYDTNHPQKYALISLGNSAILSGLKDGDKTTSWVDTLKFI